MSDPMNDNDLHRQLRQLPRDIEPPRDLWPGIAARLPAQSRHTHPRRRNWLGGLALAASLTLAIGIAWRLAPMNSQAPDRQADQLAAEVDAMVREYQFALAQLDGDTLPMALRPDLDTLDQSADSIRAALRANPESSFLLEQLRRTYSRRLTLTQRAVAG